jgi:hypothetical protein
MLQDVGSLLAKAVGGPAKSAAKRIRIKAVKYGFKEPDIFIYLPWNSHSCMSNFCTTRRQE